MKDLQSKITSLEEKFIADELDKTTYRKWKIQFQNEKTLIEERIHTLTVPISKIWKRYQENLQVLNNLPLIFQKGDIHRKQAFIKLVFDNKLYYSDGVYRTPYILPMFLSKALILKEKRLLEIEQPDRIFNKNSVSAPGGT